MCEMQRFVLAPRGTFYYLCCPEGDAERVGDCGPIISLNRREGSNSL